MSDSNSRKIHVAQPSTGVPQTNSMLNNRGRKQIGDAYDNLIGTGTDFGIKDIENLLKLMTDKLQLEPATKDQIQDLFRELDLNGNGKLSSEEIKVFKNYIKGITISSNIAAEGNEQLGPNRGSREPTSKGSRSIY